MAGSTPDNEDLPAGDTKSVETAETEAADVNIPAESSSAEDQGDKGKTPDLLETVKAALKPKEKAPASEEPGSKSDDPAATEADKEGEAAEGEADDLTEEELARLRPKTRKRIENLLRDRADRDRKIDELGPRAERFDQIATFVSEAGLTKDEVNQGFAVMRNLKQDPFKAYEVLRPIMDQLETIVGNVLPDELQQAVNRGEITEPYARQVARSKSQEQVSRQREADDQQRRETTRRQEEHRAHVETVSSKVNEWESQQSKSDPSWKLKQPLVMERMEAEVLRRQRAEPGWFPNESEAIEIAKDSLKSVNERIAALSPKKKAIQPGPDAGSNPQAEAKPTSMLEAARQGLSKARAG